MIKTTGSSITTAARVVAVGVAVVLSAASAANKADQKRTQAINEARAACYKDDFKIVYGAVFEAVRAHYQIARESERLGEIATDWAESQDSELQNVKGQLVSVPFGVRTKVTVAIKGRDCSTVVVEAPKERQDAQGAWKPLGRATEVEDEIYYAMHTQILGTRASAAPPAATTPPEAAASGVGSEGAGCFPNSTCNTGLTCASNICVRLNTAPAEGKEGGACYANTTCDQGLTCASSRCVKVP